MGERRSEQQTSAEMASYRSQSPHNWHWIKFVNKKASGQGGVLVYVLGSTLDACAWVEGAATTYVFSFLSALLDKHNLPMYCLL